MTLIREEEKVMVPVHEYESLVRDSERMEVVKNLVCKSSYVSRGDLLLVLGIEEPGKEGEE